MIIQTVAGAPLTENGDTIEMKIAISSEGQDAASKVHALFGRCDFFVIADTQTGTVEAVVNDSKESAAGAGTACVQTLITMDVRAVICAQAGPNAHEALSGAGIDLFTAPPGLSVQEAIDRFQQASLPKMQIQRF